MKWINVNDRMPEDGEEVVVYYFHEGYGESYVGTAIWEQGFWNDCEKYDWDEQVSHWCELPEPPKQ